MNDIVKVTVLGAGGRMGHALVSAMADMNELMLVGAVEAAQCPLLGKDAGLLAGITENNIRLTADLRAAAEPADVLIDFTLPSATCVHAETAAEMNKPLVIGTTGLNHEESNLVRKAAAKIPVVWAPNMSLGVNLLFAFTGKLAGILKDYDLEIVEMHHRHKKDAPSGTALRLAENAAIARNCSLEENLTHGRHGIQQTERPSGQIGMHTLRGGDVVGEHTVIFAGEGERLEMTHRASRRECFATGALRAALWVKDRKPGLYNMQDVLGITADV